MPLKYLSNFWRSFETLMINCKIELKLKWTKYCVFVSNGNDNTKAYPINIIFTIEDTKLCALLSLYQQNRIKNYQKFLENSL